MKKVILPLADGFEEIEAITVIDVLRRAGVEIVSAGLPGTMVTGFRHVKITADKKLEDTDPEEFDAVVLVGGAGYKALGKSQAVLDMIKDFNSKGKLVAAICAAPTILAEAGLLEDKLATVFPGMERQIPKPRGERVVLDGNILTSQAPGTAMEFALKIVEILLGPEEASRLKGDLVFER